MINNSFSIIIALYNAEKTIAATLDSILPQLSMNDEVIIVDDASPDNSARIVKQYSDARIKFLHHNKNKGLSKTRNTGIALAKGAYIAFMDCDDLWPQGRHIQILDVIKKTQKKVISGKIEHFFCDSMPLEERKKYRLPKVQPATLCGTMVFHRSLVKRAEQFDGSLQFGEFLDFISRMQISPSDWIKVDTVFLKRRIHGANYSLLKKEHQADYFRAVRSHIQRTHKCIAST